MNHDVKLTHREMDVVQALEEGLGTNKIAEKLFISPATVRNHINSIHNKLGLSSRLQVVAWARGETTGEIMDRPPPQPGTIGATILRFLMERGVTFTDEQAAAVCKVFQ